jgi:hypothetical protein
MDTTEARVVSGVQDQPCPDRNTMDETGGAAAASTAPSSEQPQPRKRYDVAHDHTITRQ